MIRYQEGNGRTGQKYRGSYQVILSPGNILSWKKNVGDDSQNYFK
jgi:hypothetical protein